MKPSIQHPSHTQQWVKSLSRSLSLSLSFLGSGEEESIPESHNRSNVKKKGKRAQTVKREEEEAFPFFFPSFDPLSICSP
jgi:hypothetical protein